MIVGRYQKGNKTFLLVDSEFRIKHPRQFCPICGKSDFFHNHGVYPEKKEKNIKKKKYKKVYQLTCPVCFKVYNRHNKGKYCLTCNKKYVQKRERPS